MKIKREVTLLLLETPLLYALIVVGAVLACSIIIYAMRRRGKEEEEFSGGVELQVGSAVSPFKIVKTVPRREASRADEELRLLNLEREILSGAIRRLYEAHAEGKITEEEREKIAKRYKSRIRKVKEDISQDESLIALHELESMQEDLLKLFSDRFDELSGKIEGLRSKLEVEPVKEIAVPTERKTRRKPSKKRRKKPRKKTTKKKKKTKKEKKREAKPKPKTEAERKVEKIREEVEKVLDKLGQMEVET